MSCSEEYGGLCVGLLSTYGYRCRLLTGYSVFVVGSVHGHVDAGTHSPIVTTMVSSAQPHPGPGGEAQFAGASGLEHDGWQGDVECINTMFPVHCSSANKTSDTVTRPDSVALNVEWETWRDKRAIIWCGSWYITVDVQWRWPQRASYNATGTCRVGKHLSLNVLTNLLDTCRSRLRSCRWDLPRMMLPARPLHRWEASMKSTPGNCTWWCSQRCTRILRSTKQYMN